jgi:DNA-binding HxlR family transcriptional regulator
MPKSYNQYCPIASALDLVGERWSLLIVRELLENSELRYSDLHVRLEGCGTNILAARLRHLEAGGVIRRRRLPPPASATVYQLTEYGSGLWPVMHHLAHWGARAMGPPSSDELQPGWLARALRMAFATTSSGTIEFCIDGEVASLIEGEVSSGPAASAEVRVRGTAAGFYHLVVDRDLSSVAIEGPASVLREALERLPPPTPPRSSVAQQTRIEATL